MWIQTLATKQFCIFRLVLRILPPSNFKVQCELGIKFGVNPAKAIHLLRAAKSLDLDVMGVSFHVGSGCQEPEAFVAAIQQARMVFDQGLDLGFNMTLLDIGGGFPGHAGSSIAFDAVSVCWTVVPGNLLLKNGAKFMLVKSHTRLDSAVRTG